MSNENKAIACLAAYAVVGVVIFGHAWNNTHISKFRNGLDDVPGRVISATILAVFWPIYLSVKAQDFTVEK